MNKFKGKIISILLAVAIISGSIAVNADTNDVLTSKHAAQEAQETLNKYNNQYTSLVETRTAAKEKYDQYKDIKSSRKKSYDSAVKSAKSSADFKKIQDAYDKATSNITSIKATIDGYNASISDYNNSIAKAKNDMNEEIERKRGEIIDAFDLSYYEAEKAKYDEYIAKANEYREYVGEKEAKLEKLNAQLVTAKKEYENAAKQYDEGMFGFLKWQQTAYPKYANDAKRALNILTNCQEAKYNKKGDYNNAVALVKVLKQEQFLNECNTLRQNDPHFNKKGEVLKVNSEAMAIAISNANYTALAGANGSNQDAWGIVVTSQFPVVQLIAGRADPYDTWYWDERKIYEEKNADWEFWSGHYTGLMEAPNPNVATGLAECNGVDLQIFIPAGTEYANGPLIPISEYFSMVREYYNLVYPETKDQAVKTIEKNIKTVKDQIALGKGNITSYEDRAKTRKANLDEMKKESGYSNYINMESILASIKTKYENNIKNYEKKIKNLNDQIAQAKEDLAAAQTTGLESARKTYENKIKAYPDVEKAYKSYISAEETCDYYRDKVEKADEKIKNIQALIKTAQADFDKKLAAYKQVLKDNGLKYENNKLSDPDPEPVVANPVTSITLKPRTSTTVMAGKQVTIAATVKPANANKNLTWSCSNKTYATVNSNGLVTTYPAGAGKTVVIRATAKDGSGKTTTIKLNIVKDGVTSLTLKGNTSMKARSSMKLTATVKASGSTANTEIGWKSSNKDAANVSTSGVVYANEAGKGQTVTITAYTLDGTGIKKKINITIE